MYKSDIWVENLNFVAIFSIFNFQPFKILRVDFVVVQGCFGLVGQSYNLIGGGRSTSDNEKNENHLMAEWAVALGNDYKCLGLDHLFNHLLTHQSHPDLKEKSSENKTL